MILNREDPLVMKHAARSRCGSRAARCEQRPYLTFGADMPQRPGDFGIEVVNGMAWLVRALEADETQKRKRKDERGRICTSSA